MKNLNLILVIFTIILSFSSCDDNDAIEKNVSITSVLPVKSIRTSWYIF
ncbi:MAG: hypothetical protein GQ540_04710 [Lutibacter sp.]|nr:hypothetical protein [Lutibacter sp.]NOR27813.1 hypothetical protein [Lutibacter sp.]